MGDAMGPYVFQIAPNKPGKVKGYTEREDHDFVRSSSNL